MFLLNNLNTRLNKTEVGSVDQVAPNDPNTPPLATRRELDSSELFAGNKVLLIRHEGTFYALRRTSKGKLILTK